MHIYPINYNKGAKNIQWEMIVSSISGVGKTGQPTQKNETGPPSYTIHKNQFKTD